MKAKLFAYFAKSGGLVGAGGEEIFIEVDQQIDNSFSTSVGANYFLFSPLTIASGAVLTITNGSELELI